MSGPGPETTTSRGSTWVLGTALSTLEDAIEYPGTAPPGYTSMNGFSNGSLVSSCANRRTIVWCTRTEAQTASENERAMMTTQGHQDTQRRLTHLVPLTVIQKQGERSAWCGTRCQGRERRVPRVVFLQHTRHKVPRMKPEPARAARHKHKQMAVHKIKWHIGKADTDHRGFPKSI